MSINIIGWVGGVVASLGGVGLLLKVITKANVEKITEEGFVELLKNPEFRAFLVKYKDQVNAILEGFAAGVEDAEKNA